MFIGQRKHILIPDMDIHGVCVVLMFFYFRLNGHCKRDKIVFDMDLYLPVKSAPIL